MLWLLLNCFTFCRSHKSTLESIKLKFVVSLSVINFLFSVYEILVHEQHCVMVFFNLVHCLIPGGWYKLSKLATLQFLKLEAIGDFYVAYLILFFEKYKARGFRQKQIDSGLTNRCDWTFYKSISEKTQSTSRNINYYLKDKWRAAMNNFVTLNKVVFVETLYDGCIYGICWRWNGGHYFCKSRFQPE